MRELGILSAILNACVPVWAMPSAFDLSKLGESRY